MSYILEALKKAQAERQLGNAPTIHAPTLQAAPAHVPVVKKTGLLALGIGGIVVALAGWLIWSQRAPAPVAIPATALAPATPVVVPAPVIVAQAEPVVRAKPAAPVVAAAPVPVPVPAPRPAPPSTEDTIPYASNLSQAIQQQLPHVSFGGYMYSDNAADRLVLVDKTLRHEGEEIAPGLMLEKLLPRGAVLNFRGTRYRVNF